MDNNDGLLSSTPLNLRNGPTRNNKARHFQSVAPHFKEEVGVLGGTKGLASLAGQHPLQEGAQTERPNSKEDKALKRLNTKNFHENRLDLMDYYNNKKYARAEDLAKKWEDDVGKGLHDKVEEEARKNFGKWLAAGNKLSYK